MKRTITKLWTMIIVASMLLSMIPLGISAESADECASLETVEEVPFEFELDPGDLPFEQLKEAVLEAKDIPACIDPALAEARGHVNRLYLQEPDDCSIMFQNRDGSKTVYLFSHPVKGMTMGTTATVQVNGTSISFTGTNAITSCIAELSDFNIGYAEVAYLPNGVLSVDGINLTEDARGWARCESTVSTLAYNISSEVAAEYAASVTSPNTDVATAAAVPGVTITPIDPAPIGGMTVMAISYSDLAGVMSFRNESTNQFLTLTSSSTPSLTTNSSITYKYSQWAVQYDSYFGYVVSNLSNVYNTYLGFDDMDNYIIDSLSYMMDTFTITIESTANSIVTIDCGQIAINYNGTLYEKSEDDDYFPTSCEWRILAKGTLRLATGINLPNNQTTRIVQSGVSFPFDYTFPSPAPTHYDLDLYNASNNQPFAVDSKVYEDDEYWCTINTPGEYLVYYKDNITGVTSPDFTLIVVDFVSDIYADYTYTLQPKSDLSKYLTMEAVASANGMYQANSNNISASPIVTENGYEKWDVITRTFVFEETDNGYIISATMPTKQYVNGPTQIDYNKYDGTPYELTTLEEQNNALNFSGNVISAQDHNTNNSRFLLYPVEVITNGIAETYYMIICVSNDSNVKVLSYENSNVAVSTFNAESDAQLWKITEVGTYVPLIRQNSWMSCGVATTMMYHYGFYGSLDSISGTTFLDKYETTWDLMYKDQNDGVPLDRVTSYVENANYPDVYMGYWASAYYPEAFDLEMQKNGLVISYVTMGDLPFYPSNKTNAHYVIVIGQIEATDGITYCITMDCHYDDDYHGIYLLPRDQVWDNDAGDWFDCIIVDKAFYFDN